MRLTGGNAVDAAEVGDRFLGEDELAGEWVLRVKGEWRVAGGFERLSVHAGDGRGPCFNRLEEGAWLNLVQPGIRIFVDDEQLGGDIGNDDLVKDGVCAFLCVVGIQGCRACLVDPHSLGVGGRPGEIDVPRCVALV